MHALVAIMHLFLPRKQQSATLCAHTKYLSQCQNDSNLAHSMQTENIDDDSAEGYL